METNRRTAPRTLDITGVAVGAAFVLIAGFLWRGCNRPPTPPVPTVSASPPVIPPVAPARLTVQPRTPFSRAWLTTQRDTAIQGLAELAGKEAAQAATVKRTADTAKRAEAATRAEEARLRARLAELKGR